MVVDGQAIREGSLAEVLKKVSRLAKETCNILVVSGEKNRMSGEEGMTVLRSGFKGDVERGEEVILECNKMEDSEGQE